MHLLAGNRVVSLVGWGGWGVIEPRMWLSRRAGARRREKTWTVRGEKSRLRKSTCTHIIAAINIFFDLLLLYQLIDLVATSLPKPHTTSQLHATKAPGNMQLDESVDKSEFFFLTQAVTQKRRWRCLYQRWKSLQVSRHGDRLLFTIVSFDRVPWNVTQSLCQAPCWSTVPFILAVGKLPDSQDTSFLRLFDPHPRDTRRKYAGLLWCKMSFFTHMEGTVTYRCCRTGLNWTQYIRLTPAAHLSNKVILLHKEDILYYLRLTHSQASSMQPVRDRSRAMGSSQDTGGSQFAGMAPSSTRTAAGKQ